MAIGITMGWWSLTAFKVVVPKVSITDVFFTRKKVLVRPTLFIEIKPGIWTEVTSVQNTFTICRGKVPRLRTDAIAANYDWEIRGSTFTEPDNPYTPLPAAYSSNSGNINVSVGSGSIRQTSLTLFFRTVDAVPLAPMLGASSTSICGGGGSTVTLTATLPGTSEEIDSLYWFKGGATTPFTSTLRGDHDIVVNSPGTYTVKAVNDCGLSILSNSVTVSLANTAPTNLKITSNNTENLICGTTSTLLKASATGLNLRYQWFLNGTSPGDAISGAVMDTYTATTPGTYHVIISNGCGSPSTSIELKSADKPGGIFINKTSANVFCGPLFPRLSAGANLSPGSAVFRYEWFKDGDLVKTSSGAPDNTFTPSANGNYTVTVYNACGGTTSSPLTITSVTPPTFANIKASRPPSLGCSTSSLELSVETDGTHLQYIWKKDGINVGTGATLNVTSSGDYQVEVKSVNPADASICGSQTSAAVKIPFISTPPTTIAVSAPSTTTCDGKITLTANSDGEGLQYIWYKDGVVQAITLVNTYVATSNGTYSVQSENACDKSPVSNSITLDIKTVPNVVDIIASETLVCGTGTVSLSANVTGNGLTIEWFLEGQKVGDGKQISVTKTGEYLLRVTSVKCGTKEAKKLIRFVTEPSSLVIIPGSATKVCNSSNPVTLHAQFTGSPVTYEWFKDGGSVVGTESTFDATSAGRYSLRVTNECGNAISTEDIEITFGGALATPQILIQNNNGSSELCKATNIDLRASQSEGIVQYRWFKNNQLINSANGEVLAVTEPGEYRVEISKNGCSALSAIKTITATPPPPAIIKSLTPLEFCQGDSTVLTTEILDVTAQYQWQLNGSIVSTKTSFTAKESGFYTLKVTNSCGFSNTSEVEVKVTTSPTTEIILSNNVLSVLNANIRKYQWYLNDKPVIGGNEPTFTPIEQGDYFVRITTDIGCEGESNILTFSGVNTTADPVINIAPNPTSTGRITVTLLSGLDAQISLLNNTGKVLYSKNFPKNITFVNQRLIDIGDLQQGIYLLKASFSNGKTVTTKVLVF